MLTVLVSLLLIIIGVIAVYAGVGWIAVGLTGMIAAITAKVKRG